MRSRTARWTRNRPKYRREFFKSPHHAWLGLRTIGAGLILGADYPLALLVAPAAYLPGWVYPPDLPLFRRWVDGRRHRARHKAGLAEATELARPRDERLARLAASHRQHYQSLAAVCRDIEHAGADQSLTPGDPAADPRLHKRDELMAGLLAAFPRRCGGLIKSHAALARTDSR